MPGFAESKRAMPLEVSENTHEQDLRVVVATAAQRGEDMPAKGAVMVFDIIDVVPEPGVPESGFKLHLVSREEARGAIPLARGVCGADAGGGPCCSARTLSSSISPSSCRIFSSS